MKSGRFSNIFDLGWFSDWTDVQLGPQTSLIGFSNRYFLSLQARNRSGQVGYVPEKYLQLPSSNSLLSMLQSLATLDARSHSSSNSTEPETELPSGSVNGDSSGEETLHPTTSVAFVF